MTVSLFTEYSISEDFAFIAIVLVLLYVNLKVHKDKPITTKDAAMWSIIWVAVSFLFAGYLALVHGQKDASVFLTGYLIEKSLSIDNLFIIMAVFASFRIEEKYQHRVLYYGILLALVLRLIFILAGVALIELGGKYVSGVFGIIILWSAWKMLQSTELPKEGAIDYTQHPIIKVISKFFPIYPRVDNQSFFVKTNPVDNSGNSIAAKKRWHATPLFLCLIAMEFIDVVFAFDSVPAIFAVTNEPFLVYSASIFAILGLRSLYFLIVAAKRYLCHIEKSVVAILIFIGGQMVLEAFELINIEPFVSLCIITSILAVGAIMSRISSGRAMNSP